MKETSLYPQPLLNPLSKNQNPLLTSSHRRMLKILLKISKSPRVPMRPILYPFAKTPPVISGTPYLLFAKCSVLKEEFTIWNPCFGDPKESVQKTENAFTIGLFKPMPIAECFPKPWIWPEGLKLRGWPPISLSIMSWWTTLPWQSTINSNLQIQVNRHCFLWIFSWLCARALRALSSKIDQIDHLHSQICARKSILQVKRKTIHVLLHETSRGWNVIKTRMYV